MDLHDPLRVFDEFRPEFKQVKFERKIVEETLVGCGADATTMKMLRNAAYKDGDGITTRWFNASFPRCPVALETRKLAREISFGQICRGAWKKVEHVTAYEDARQNWPGEPILLVFDRHGDDVPCHCLFEWAPLMNPQAPWIQILRPPERVLYLQPWVHTLQRLADHWRVE
jgi:hypothetical protein